MKRIKPIYFSDRKGFLLTFGPEDDELLRWVAPLGSDRIREILGTNSFEEIERVSGGRVREWMRERLRETMRGTPRETSRPIAEGIPGRPDGWPERDLAIAPRVERLLETWAPNASRVLDPLAGSGLYPVVAAQRGAEAFWCEISPVQRFLAVTRFRALYREDTERRQLAGELSSLADSLPSQIARAGSGELVEVLRSFADRGAWIDSGMARDLFRAAVVSLLADGVELSPLSVALELRRHAHYLAGEKRLETFPTLLANDASDLSGMRSLRADVLLTNPPFVSRLDSFPSAAEEFLSIDTAAERRRAVASSLRTGEIPRGRATALHLDHALRELRALGDSEFLVGEVDTIEEPGKASLLARYFAGLLRISRAVERHLASRAVAIIDVPDSWFGGRLLRNADIVASIFASFGFETVETESVALRAAPSGEERLQQHVVIMRRGASSSAQKNDWAVWA